MKKIDCIILFVALIVSIVVYQYNPPAALFIPPFTAFGVFISNLYRKPKDFKTKKKKPMKITHRRKN